MPQRHQQRVTPRLILLSRWASGGHGWSKCRCEEEWCETKFWWIDILMWAWLRESNMVRAPRGIGIPKNRVEKGMDYHRHVAYGQVSLLVWKTLGHKYVSNEMCSCISGSGQLSWLPGCGWLGGSSQDKTLSGSCFVPDMVRSPAWMRMSPFGTASCECCGCQRYIR